MHAVLSHAAMAALLALSLAACESTPASSAGNDSVPQAAEQKPDPTPIKLNIDELFPAGPGRDLVLNNCQTCHNFVPILTLQMDASQWDRNSTDHRERIQLADSERNDLYAYLKKNFNPDRPVPKLPKEMLDSWTSY